MSARSAQSRRSLAPEKDVTINSEGERPLCIEWGWMSLPMEEEAWTLTLALAQDYNDQKQPAQPVRAH